LNNIVSSPRYHYYLQVKSDILEGTIHCNTGQACLLASYSMQAEFGNYCSERHTTEYLQQYTFFSNVILISIVKSINFTCFILFIYIQKVTKTDSNEQNILLHTAICQYKNFANITQATAEEMYISIVMQLDGYGNEMFTAKVSNIALRADWLICCMNLYFSTYF